MNKNYETVFIINPVLSEKQVEDTVKKYKKILDTGKVKTVCDESLGFKELAYPINNKNSGFFHLFQYETRGEGRLIEIKIIGSFSLFVKYLDKSIDLGYLIHQVNLDPSIY
jgi:small subunit ribosomal protein S6